jgi:hypothetical protein
MDHLQQFIDLRRADIDPEVFAAALAVRHVSNLIASGGGIFGRPDLESTLYPQQFEAFLARAIEATRKSRHFEREWQGLQRFLPHMKAAWEKGQALFQAALAHTIESDEEMDYLSQIDFALECYAYVSASRAYPDDPPLQAWAISGYMLAWRKQFLADGSDAL